ncbi:hypothetical protein C3B55_00140 [Candidatus Pseudomonas adelgestsugas]|uniref:Uncharacterized protein n=1 Tax=Candidatus Pseudomonas adelgestsugas TaxID=1302376 RepID=A0ABX5R849_9PSED|nr:hypothetical protein C3B55_00140 [Candidatus Pseudomonas adelgestsugas]
MIDMPKSSWKYADEKDLTNMPFHSCSKQVIYVFPLILLFVLTLGFYIFIMRNFYLIQYAQLVYLIMVDKNYPSTTLSFCSVRARCC